MSEIRSNSVCSHHSHLEEYIKDTRQALIDKLVSFEKTQSTILEMVKTFPEIRDKLSVLEATYVKSNGFVALRTEFDNLKKIVTLFSTIVLVEVVGLLGVGLVYIINKVIKSV